MKATIFGLLILLMASTAMAQAPQGTEITYQGELQEAGLPLDASTDFIFTLYDAELAGATVGIPLQLDDVTVENGLFTVQLDFGAGIFEGEARWLEIAVRSPHDPSDTDPFTTLDPRQAVTAAPYALHALNAEGSWDVVGSAIQNNNPGFVGVGRSNQVSSAESFGVHTPTSDNYGGMYVSTDGGTSLPFFGYFSGNDFAWSYLDGGTGDWRLNVDGDRLTVTDSGEVGIGTTSPTEKLEVAGTVHSTSGGFKFPDGTVQGTAAASGLWQASGSGITNTAPGFVGINRDYLVGSEWFGVHAPISSGYGGMYISTEGGTSLPFYGYYTGSEFGWSYLDASTGDWHLNLDGNRLTVTDTGEVGIGTTAPAEMLEVAGTVHSTSGGFKFPDGSTQTTAAGASLWQASGSAIMNSNPGFVGVGRSNQVSGAEVFGIQSPTLSGYGGMYIGTDGGDGLPFYGYSTGTESAWSYMDGSTGNWHLNVDGNRLTVTDEGNVGIGTTNPLYKIDMQNGDTTANILNVERTAVASASSDILQIISEVGSSSSSQLIEAQIGTDIKFRVWGDGDVTADGAFTGGGADFAEIVKVESGADSVEPGDVLVIDVGARRGFAKSSGERSTLVAGVFSTQPGVLASNRDWDALERSLDGFSGEGEQPSTPVLELAARIDEIPLAVVGIVPCKVSTENGAIAVGDLLVTSSTPGHAMRAENPGVGTVVGKALEPLNGGSGLIEILVTLQ